MIEHTQAKVDAAIAAGALSAFWWMPHFDGVVHVLLALGAVALVVLRIGIAWREWRKGLRRR